MMPSLSEWWIEAGVNDEIDDEDQDADFALRAAAAPALLAVTEATAGGVAAKGGGEIVTGAAAGVVGGWAAGAVSFVFLLA
mmetsp:Transcript_51716/g.88743  ORF Transcript_51716/g.88743 Transcript_51716/m.88743 type:complete len:81 (-) Transcript_51716:109-351(-)